MEKRIYDKKTGINYELQGDYYLPCLELPEQPKVEIGIWGAGVRWTPLPQAEAPTEPTGETVGIFDISVSIAKGYITACFSAGSSTAALLI